MYWVFYICLCYIYILISSKLYIFIILPAELDISENFMVYKLPKKRKLNLDHNLQ